ncbi:precorrin-6A synthase (deacetylating) [Nakamurella sp. YIM 132087]|uniref:Precorrin-6A synthase (Deacetylating) n=1 Tax=Nakamurella alba TaxID=2665158 RepID=A0A7K1FG26_9ACTN|nr:precorrin-6A synthase (deacetylating) [Nakamurella alba]
MAEVLLVGVGAGDPEQLTLQAIRAIERADVFLVIGKDGAAAELETARRDLLSAHRPEPARVVVVPDPARDRDPQDYRQAVLDWHAARAGRLAAAMEGEPDGTVAAILVWGDPALYDSTIRVVGDVAATHPVLRWSVIPAVSSVSALAAAHRTVLNSIGGAVHITTGRRLRQGWPGADIDSVVVMLDPDLACAALDPAGLEIFWGANLGTPGEVLAAGPLADTLPEIRRLRDGVRADRGWVMDVYLLRRV